MTTDLSNMANFARHSHRYTILHFRNGHPYNKIWGSTLIRNSEIQNYLLPHESLGPTSHDPYGSQSTGNGSHHWWFYSLKILRFIFRMQIVNSCWVPFEFYMSIWPLGDFGFCGNWSNTFTSDQSLSIRPLLSGMLYLSYAAPWMKPDTWWDHVASSCVGWLLWMSFNDVGPFTGTWPFHL